MNRLISFFRSVLPADPWQLVFLFGVVSLTFCIRLTWFPEPNAIAAVKGDHGTLFDWRGPFRTVLIFAMYPIIFSSLAGYFVCFWPGLRPSRRILLSVLLPAFVGLAAIFVMLATYSPAPTSVLQSNSPRAENALNTMFFFVRNSVGLHYCFLGLLSVSIFTLRLNLGASHLPLSLQGLRTGEDRLWDRTITLVYLMIGPIYLVDNIVATAAAIPFIVGVHPTFGMSSVVLLSELAGTLLVVCVALWAMPLSGRRAALGALRIPKLAFFWLALGSASVIAAAIPVSIYLFDRAHWAAFNYGNLSPPDLSNYFAAPNMMVVFGIAAAIAEEIIFRGFMQPRMTERYGLLRGIFVTGTIWAAIHFREDPYPRHSDLGVVIHLALRIAMCLALSFVFGWLTLKSGSILPAMLAHAATNLFAHSAVAFDHLPGESSWAINIVLWAILASVLFRHWPIRSEPEPLPVIDK